MDLQEEFTQILMKGKRTKRPRQASPLALTMASTSSSSLAEGGSIGCGISENACADGGSPGGPTFDRTITVSTTTTSSGELTDHSVEKEEEEDMANCLILLAKGHHHYQQQTLKTPEKPLIRSTYYQCKTCERSFPSFQALGGHRASHNKPNRTGEEKKASTTTTLITHEEAEQDNIALASTTLSLQIIPSSRVSPPSGSNNAKSRVHECSICGAEFSSGQALGGHMRRHRSAPPMAAMSCDDEINREVKKSKNVLGLDLNQLPAPEDENRESKFVFVSKKQQQVIVFSASPLVDCHY